MFGYQLKEHYESLLELGLVRSQRDFSRAWLGRSCFYLRNIEPRDRGWRKLSPATAARLHAHLVAVAAKVPPQVAEQITTVVRAIDRDMIIADEMAGWGR